MSSFTAPIRITAIRTVCTGWRAWLPPSFWPEEWEVADCFDYAVGSLDQPVAIIRVLEGFRFDGASIPLPLRWALPKIHTQYLQAAALHDWLYRRQWMHRLNRRHADAIFAEAMAVLGTPPAWCWLMWAAVRLGGSRAWMKGKRHGR